LTLPQAVTAALALRLPVLGLGLAGFGVWLFVNPGSGVREAAALLLLAVVSQFLIGLRTIATSFLRAHDRQNGANILNVLQPVGYFAVVISLLTSRVFQLLPLFAGILLVEICLTVLSVFVVKNIQMPPTICKRIAFSDLRASLAAIWKPSLIFFVVSFWATIQSRLDWIMVYGYGSKTELAYYSLANKVYEVFESGVSVVINTVFPWMCKLLMSGDKNPRMLVGFKGIAFLATFLAAATALYFPGLLTIFWGEKFDQANNLVFLLMCGACLNNLCSVMYYLLIAAGKEKYFLVICPVPAIFQIVANILLIPKYGNHGAAISMLILITTSFLLISIVCIKNKLAEYISLSKNTIIVSLVIAGMVFFKQQLQQSYFHTTLFLITTLFLGSMILFSKQERSLVLAELREALSSLSPRIGKHP
jgi:O-antigen/teichoic acid export membrane protein